MHIKTKNKADADKIIDKANTKFGFPSEDAITYAIPWEYKEDEFYIPVEDLQYNQKIKEFVKIKLPEDVDMTLVTDEDYKQKKKEKDATKS